MKKILSIALFLFVLTGMAQNAKPDQLTMKKAKLLEAKTVYDLFPDFPKEFKSISIDMVGKINGKVSNTQSNETELSPSILQIIKNADLGTKLYFDIKVTDKTVYVFIRSILVE